MASKTTKKTTTKIPVNEGRYFDALLREDLSMCVGVMYDLEKDIDRALKVKDYDALGQLSHFRQLLTEKRVDLERKRFEEEKKAAKKAALKQARKVGNWGETIWFEVSSKKQLTFRNFTKTHSARWKDHEIIGHKPLSEFAGPDLVSVTMSCVFSAAMKVNPRKTMLKLEKALAKGKVDYLYVKDRKVGSNKMKLVSMSEAYDVVLINGAIAKATVDLTFSEYVSRSYKHGKKVAGTRVPWEFTAGEKPTFTGGKSYSSCETNKGAKKRTENKVTVLEFRKGKKHPYRVEAIVNKNKAESYKKKVEEIQKKLKTASRTEKKELQKELTTLKSKKPIEKPWKAWVDSGTLRL